MLKLITYFPPVLVNILHSSNILGSHYLLKWDSHTPQPTMGCIQDITP